MFSAMGEALSSSRLPARFSEPAVRHVRSMQHRMHERVITISISSASDFSADPIGSDRPPVLRTVQTGAASSAAN